MRSHDQSLNVMSHVSNSIYKPPKAITIPNKHGIGPQATFPYSAPKWQLLSHSGCQTHLSYSTVRRLYSTISHTLSRQHSGCPTKLSPQDQRTLIQKVTSGAADTTTKLKKTLDLDVCIQVIRTTLTKEALMPTVEQYSPFFPRLMGGKGWTLLLSTSARLWRTEGGLFSQVRLKLIG